VTLELRVAAPLFFPGLQSCITPRPFLSRPLSPSPRTRDFLSPLRRHRKTLTFASLLRERTGSFFPLLFERCLIEEIINRLPFSWTACARRRRSFSFPAARNARNFPFSERSPLPPPHPRLALLPLLLRWPSLCHNCVADVRK